MPFHHQTHTAVHSQEARCAQRQGAAQQNHFTLSALLFYAQLVIGLAFFLYGHVSTPGYMSLLLLFFPLAGVYFLCCRLARQNIASHPAARAGNLLLGLCLFIDAQLCLYAFCDLMREMLPKYSTILIAPITLGCVMAALHRQNSRALPALARFLRLPLGIGLGFCLLGAVPRADAGNLFPLLGLQPGRILTGSLYMCSTLSCAFTPFFVRPGITVKAQAQRGFCSLGLALALGVLTALLTASLLPIYFLARPNTIGGRMLLPLKVNPALIAWSLMTCLMLLLLLLALAGALSRSRRLLSQAVGRRIHGAVSLALVPLPALSTDLAGNITAWLAPARLALMGLALVFYAIAALSRREAPAQ